jgi:signal peptidase I
MNDKNKTEKKVESKVVEPKSTFREYFESLVTTLVMAIFGMTFVVQAVTVPTGSMQNTILIDDYFLVNKFIFPPEKSWLPFLPQRDIERGDIVVFKYPGYRDGKKHDDPPEYVTSYIKRVIGMPGETVEFKDNNIYVNGQLLPEHRLSTSDPQNRDAPNPNVKEIEPKEADDKWSVTYSENTLEAVKKGINVASNMKYAVKDGIMKVPEGQYLMIGDNRDNSLDSRAWGFVPRELIIGRAMFIYWSCDKSDSARAGGCLANPRFDRLLKQIK